MSELTDRELLELAARETGAVIYGDEPRIDFDVPELLSRFTKFVRVCEREACARICDEARNHPDVSPLILANRIRARGNNSHEL